MKRHLVLGLAAVGLVLAGFALAHAQSAFAGKKPAVNSAYPWPQPDINAPEWKPVSDDLGVWLSTSERFGLQARLYARVDGLWVPVAVDGTRELHGVMPVR